MGKIFKALKKAEKDNAASPAHRSLQDPDSPSRQTVSPPVNNKPVARPDQRRGGDHMHPGMQTGEQPGTTRPPAASPARRTPDRARVPAEPQAPASEPILAQRPEMANAHEEILPIRQAPTPALEPGPTQISEAAGKPDSLKFALVKPEITEPPHPFQGAAPISQTQTAGMQTDVSVQPPSAKEVRVRYSRTQVQINDPETLRNNKIITMFDDMETSDQIKILRTQALRKLKAIGGNSILITSANPYEGKTFTSINLGVSIAKEFDRTVLIIDADVRRPTRDHTSFSTEFFSLNVEKGLTDYLEGEADISDILINPGIEKLTLIPGGMPVDNSSELLNSGRMEEMMAEIKSRYPADRVVIVDGPAILPFSDAMILTRYVDGVILVIEAERTSNEDLRKMMLRLKEVNVLGTVLNKNRE